MGEVKRIIMGLDRHKKTPCGFCFVEYYSHEDALDCMKFVNGTKLDERVIRTDIDPGYKPDRQYGRGRSGGQVRDEHREDFDQGRGGWGARLQQDEKRERVSRETYQSHAVPEGASSSYYSKGPMVDVNKKRARLDDELDEYQRQRGSNPRFRESSPDRD